MPSVEGLASHVAKLLALETGRPCTSLPPAPGPEDSKITQPDPSAWRCVSSLPQHGCASHIRGMQVHGQRGGCEQWKRPSSCDLESTWERREKSWA